MSKVALALLAVTVQGPPVTTAVANGKGQIELHLVYFAEDTCVSFRSVTAGHPKTMEAPKRAPAVTVVLNRAVGPHCLQKLVKLEHVITLEDRPKALSVEVLYVSPEGTFIRSSRPPIERPGDDGELE